MVSWITFAWQIEIVAVVILIYALITFLRAIIKLDKEFKIGLLLVLGSVIINVALGVLMGIFLTSGANQEQLLNFWILRPIITLVVAISVLFAAKKFVSAMEKNKQ